MRPEIKRAYPVYWLDDSTVRIGAEDGATRELTDPRGELRHLLTLLDGRHTVPDIVERMCERVPYLTETDVLAGLATFDEEGLLADASGFDDLEERHHANHSFFTAAAANTEHDANRAQRRLGESHIVLLGLGGGGSACLPQLLALGPRRVSMVDADTVSMSNLNRQTLFAVADVGRKKLDVAVEYCRAFAPDTAVDAHDMHIASVDDVALVAERADVIICTIDQPAFIAQRRVNAAGVRLGIPIVTMLSQHTKGRLFSVQPGRSGCLDCLHIHDEPNTEDFLPQFRAIMRPQRDGATAVIAAHAQRLTSYGVDEAIRLITLYAEPLAAGKQVEVDYLSGRLRTLMDWGREPGCPTCGERDPRFDHLFDVAPL